MNDNPLTEKEFQDIYSRVPRLTVEIIVLGGSGIYLTKRSIEPCKGLWHLPGGTVRFGESLLEAVKRIALRELKIEVKDADLLGYIEYPSHYLNGLDSPVGIAFLINKYRGKLDKNDEALEAGWFQSLPESMHEEQVAFIQDEQGLI